MLEPAEIIAMWDHLDADRSAVKTLVQQVLQYCLPRCATVTVRRTEGQEYASELLDSTAERALQRFAAGFYNYMWNPERPNVMLLPPEGPEQSSEESARPLMAIADVLRREMAASNLAEAFYQDTMMAGSAGVATLEVARGVQTLFEFTSHPFEQVTFSEDSRGRVDTVFRRFSWTARQIVQEFGQGEPKVGKSVWDAYNQPGGKGREKKFEIVHAAIPRSEFTMGRRDVLNMPVASLWASVTDKVWLRRSGWPQQRYLVWRFARAPGEKHGRSPGMTGLPDIKLVNRIEETVMVGAENVVRPRILAPDTSFLRAAKLGNASMLYYRLNSINPMVRPEPFNSGARVDFGLDYADSKRDIIKQVFLNDLFMILSDDKQRTATEVRGIMGEKLAMLGPIWGPMKVERFDPMVAIELSILGEVPSLLRGLPPEYLRAARIRYISTVALALQFAELTALRDGWLFLSPLAEVDPTVWDEFSFGEIAREIAQNLAWPARWLKSRDEVKALRESRMLFQQQQAQQAMAMQQAALAAKATKRPEAGSPAEAMMQEAA